MKRERNPLPAAGRDDSAGSHGSVKDYQVQIFPFDFDIVLMP